MHAGCDPHLEKARLHISKAQYSENKYGTRDSPFTSGILM